MSGSLSTAVNKPVDSLLDDSAEKAAVDLLTRAHSSKFMIDWVRDNLLDVLVQDLEAQHGARCTVKFVVRERPGTEAEVESAAQPAASRPEAAASAAPAP